MRRVGPRFESSVQSRHRVLATPASPSVRDFFECLWSAHLPKPWLQKSAPSVVLPISKTSLLMRCQQTPAHVTHTLVSTAVQAVHWVTRYQFRCSGSGVPKPALAFTERFKAWLGSLHDLAISHPIRKAKTRELKIKIWRSNWDMTL